MKSRKQRAERRKQKLRISDASTGNSALESCSGVVLWSRAPESCPGIVPWNRALESCPGIVPWNRALESPLESCPGNVPRSRAPESCPGVVPWSRALESCPEVELPHNIATTSQCATHTCRASQKILKQLSNRLQDTTPRHDSGGRFRGTTPVHYTRGDCRGDCGGDCRGRLQGATTGGDCRARLHREKSLDLSVNRFARVILRLLIGRSGVATHSAGSSAGVQTSCFARCREPVSAAANQTARLARGAAAILTAAARPSSPISQRHRAQRRLVVLRHLPYESATTVAGGR
jgi:hypothetical protein